MVRLILAVMVCLASASRAAAPARPNVIFIIADDLGYGDVGVFHQNARMAEGKPAFSTPHLDRLAASGVMLRQHYTGSPVCAPARASLQTGLMQGSCPIRDDQFDKPIPAELMTLGTVMQKAGYYTGAIGKWGLGGHKNSNFPAHPMKRGYDSFFGFMLHGTGHTYYHDKAHPLMEGEQDVGGEYENVYSTDLFTARAKQFVTDREKQHPEQPFFLYLAYTAVHGVLQVPGEAYPAGGLQWPPKPTPETRDKWIHPDYAAKPWSDPMKRYATMARRMDDGVGDLLQLLRDLHIDQKTLVVFTSDNGPEDWSGSDPRFFDSWGPFDGIKRDVFEGGVREPTLVAWPGHVPAGRVDETVSGFWDWMPTLAEVAGLPGPAQSDGTSLLPVLLDKGNRGGDPYIYVEYNHVGGWKQPSEVAVAARKGPTRGQQQMVRIGDWVGVRTQIKSAGDPLRLYDVVKDPHQDHDLAGEAGRGEVLARMRELLVTARRPEADAPRPYDEVPMPAVAERHVGAKGELTRVVLLGDFPFTPGAAAFAGGRKESAAGLAMPEGLPCNAFTMELRGYLTVPAEGAYTFIASSDAGVQLWLHEARVLGSEIGKPTRGTVHLSAGAHPFRLAYRHGDGVPALSLQYSGPAMAERAVPLSAFATAKE